MRITSSYKMKLTGDLKALETSINIYRDALRSSFQLSITIGKP